MLTRPLLRRALAEAVGTGTLVAAVIGSGIMATDLTTDRALQLLVNAVATVAVLAVLVGTLGPVSGAHLNPAVTLVELVRRDVGATEAVAYLGAQVAGGLLGAAVADLMFGRPAWQASTHERTGAGLWLGEVVATAGLLLLVGLLTRTRPGHLGPLLVPAWIGGAYFFTSSTSFANPAVTLARTTSDTFAGIAPSSLPGFVVAQLVGAALGALLAAVLVPVAGHAAPPDLPEEVHRP
ncbi:MIP/aquaporin family protein [Angustibacter peucedani]